MSLVFTLMLQCSSLRRGRTRRPYHPICCPCLCVSQLISLTKSGIIFQLSFIPFLSIRCRPLSLYVSLCQSFPHISRRPPPPPCPGPSAVLIVHIQHMKMSMRHALKKVHKIAITCVKYRLFHRCFMKMRIRTCLKQSDDKSSLIFN